MCSLWVYGLSLCRLPCPKPGKAPNASERLQSGDAWQSRVCVGDNVFSAALWSCPDNEIHDAQYERTKAHQFPGAHSRGNASVVFAGIQSTCRRRATDVLDVLALFARPVRLLEGDRYVQTSRVEEEEEEEDHDEDPAEKHAGVQQDDEEEAEQGKPRRPRVSLGSWFKDKDDRARKLAEILLQVLSGGYARDMVFLSKHNRFGFLAEGAKVQVDLAEKLWSVVAEGGAEHAAATTAAEEALGDDAQVKRWLEKRTQVLQLPFKNLKTEAVRAQLCESFLKAKKPNKVLYVWNGDSIRERPSQPWTRRGAFGRFSKKILNSVCKIAQDMVSKGGTVGFSDYAVAVGSDGGLRSQRLVLEKNKVFGLSAKEILVSRSRRAKKETTKKQRAEDVQHVYIAAALTSKKQNQVFLRGVAEKMASFQDLGFHRPAFPLVSCEATRWSPAELLL